MIRYLIELSVIHFLLVLVYRVFLINENQYDKLRYYLLIGTLLAVLIPLITLSGMQSPFAEQDELSFIITLNPVNHLEVMATQKDHHFDYYNLFYWIYGGVSLFLLLRIIHGLIDLLRLYKLSMPYEIAGIPVRVADDLKGSFSFIKWIFIDRNIAKTSDVIAVVFHEHAHVKFGHFYDLIFLQIFRAMFWWLPSAWFVHSELKKIHEYQADAYASRLYGLDDYSMVLISSTLKAHGLGLASSFHDGLILKRLNVMKQQVSKISKWKLSLMTVMTLLITMFFACSGEETSNGLVTGDSSLNEGEVFTVVEDYPKYPGGLEALQVYINDGIVYPGKAIEAGISGKVFVQFDVAADGTAEDLTVISGIGGGCDEEAVRVISGMQKWTPGTQRGKPVRVRMVLPVQFSLGGEGAEGAEVLDDLASNLIKEKQMLVDAKYKNGTWSGRVFSEGGDKPLAGTSIIISGTSRGTVVDRDGTFEIEAPENAELVASYVGYETAKITRQ